METYPYRTTPPGCWEVKARRLRDSPWTCVLGYRPGWALCADRAFQRRPGNDGLDRQALEGWLSPPCIRAVTMATTNRYMWECLLLTSRAVPTTATGPLRWVPSLDGNRLVGGYLPT